MLNGKYQTELHFVLRTKELKPIIMNATNMTNATKSIGNGFKETWVGHKVKISVECGIRVPGTKKSDNITTDVLRIIPRKVNDIPTKSSIIQGLIKGTCITPEIIKEFVASKNCDYVDNLSNDVFEELKNIIKNKLEEK